MLPTEQEIDEIRLQMVNFARLQLKESDLAEDVVQETLVSAYKNLHAFRGQAALKTWLFAILKNKIIDLIKARARTVNVSELIEEECPHQFFDDTGYWQSETYEPKEWEDVNQITYKKEFWAIFDICLNKLPAQQARVFMMREHLEMSNEYICSECGITTSHLHVILYRARLQLQSCLAKNWFEGEKE